MSFKNLLKSRKGQAFSTFQLLIAAVVALAILALLLPMITNSVNIGTSPSDTMTNSLKSARDEPGNLLISEEVKFSAGETPFINTSAIIEGTGLGSDQVRFFTGGYDNDFSIEGEDNANILHILKDETIKYKIATICDSSEELLIEDILDYSLADVDIDIGTNTFENINSTACLIYPIKK